MAAEEEELFAHINDLEESIHLTWTAMESEPMTPAEREKARKSIDSLVAGLEILRTKFVQLPKDAET